MSSNGLSLHMTINTQHKMSHVTSTKTNLSIYTYKNLYRNTKMYIYIEILKVLNLLQYSPLCDGVIKDTSPVVYNCTINGDTRQTFCSVDKNSLL